MLALNLALVLAAAAPTYSSHFDARFDPDAGLVHARIEVRQDAGQLRHLDFATGARFGNFSGDGTLKSSGARLAWSIPRKGGCLTYSVEVDSMRSGAFDARLAKSWSIVRLGDLFPPARATTRPGARGQATLSLSGPKDWRFATRYGRGHRNLVVTNSERRFSRPTGWLAAGRLGIRRDQIAGRDVAVAAPVDQGARRLDTLAFLRWTVPDLTRVFPAFPERALIVRAGAGMWRGGLSGPGSLFLHVDRPLISENGTSSLLHELVHVATAPPADGDDWLVEGLAEYYSLEILRRTGTISEPRFEKAFEQLSRWAERDEGELSDPSTGPDTARAALLLRDLATELAASGASLDDVVRAMADEETTNRASLIQLVEQALGGPSTTLEMVEAAPAG